MPTCLACAQGWPLTTGAFYAANSRGLTSRWIASRAFRKLSAPIEIQIARVPGGELSYRNHTVSIRRPLATSATASKSSTTKIPSRTHQTLTLLHKTTTFLDHALHEWPNARANSETLSFWRGTLSGLSVELSAGELVNPKARVTGEHSVTSSCGGGDSDHSY